ncbi:oxaloacetate decarboxylase subunit gamma [Poriferisphaera corsica]|uniref:Oxaloacetate decarboxylase subunit gamma n=1 Tax=Poriferisphaera corsica TaxID=2528020 RepID=A0A517YYU6_9BACT|nr:OadG family protein [Poriferisphaera corsica]QDU35387.1 oxaloacetate decarboxylase subunit gamma [Poriferisphaera corsica]
MLTNLTTLALTSEQLTGGIVLMIVGMGVVFSALILLLWAIKLMHAMLNKPAPAPAVAAASVPVASAKAASDEIEPETLVVIAAAVAAIVRKPHRIRRVDSLTAQQAGSNWARHGRRAIMTSHRPTRR